jgi:hypothetical protein
MGPCTCSGPDSCNCGPGCKCTACGVSRTEKTCSKICSSASKLTSRYRNSVRHGQKRQPLEQAFDGLLERGLSVGTIVGCVVDVLTRSEIWVAVEVQGIGNRSQITTIASPYILFGRLNRSVRLYFLRGQMKSFKSKYILGTELLAFEADSAREVSNLALSVISPPIVPGTLVMNRYC